MGYPTGIENIPFIKTGKRTTTIDAHTFPDDIVHVAVGLYSSSSSLYGVVLANGDLYIKSNTGMTNQDAINFRSAYGFTGSWQKFKTGVAKVDTGGPYLHVLYKNRTLERYISSNTMPTNLGTAQAMWDGINSEFVYVKADGTLNNTVFPTNKSYVAVRIGQRGTMALASDGTLYYVYSSSVVQIGTNVKEMSMSGGSTGRLNYLKHDGTVWSAVAVDNPSFAQVTGFPSSVKSLVDVVDGQTYALLVDGSVYRWSAPGAAVATSIVTDSGCISIYGDGGGFITNNIPGKPIPDHIPDTLRVGKRPVFEATINDDVENDSQAFVLQLATNSAFTENLLDFRSDFRIEGWEAFDGTVWDTFQPGGKIRPAQLVRDYGFEGVLGGIWKWDVGPLGTGDKINNAHEQKRNGNYSLRIVAASGNNIGVQQELKGWKPGDKVTLDAYVNITKYATGRLNVDLVAYDANGKNLIDTSGIVVEGITTGFTKISDSSITIPANTKTLLVRVFVDGAPNMTAYIDDVTVLIDGVKKYNKVRYTIGVDAYYGEPLTEGKTYYWRMAAKDGLTGTLSEWTDQQTLTNRLGTSGKCESAADWGAYNCTVITDTTNKVDGNASIKVTATNKNVAAAYKDVGGWKAGKYYVILGFIKNGNAENGARIIPSGPTYSASWQIYDKTKFNFYWCKTAPTTDYPGNLDLGFTPTEAGQYAYFDQVRVYEISKAEYELISVDPSWSGELLALRYPYVDNTQTIQRKTRIRCGTTLALQTKPIKTTAPVDRSVFSKFATLPIHVPAVKRVENTDSRITYSSGGLAWNNINYVDAGSSQGTIAYIAGVAGAWAELSFIGTGIRFGSWLSPWYGLVDVYIDNVLVKTVSQYVPEGYVGNTKQQVVYENTKLPYGPHKIKIVNRNEKADPAALGMSCALDFFEILDTKAPAVLTVQSSNNANDANPTWEDVTDVFLSGDYFRYKNLIKTAPDWGLALKITVDAKERLGPIEIDGFGISYE
ncbi:hypothetical protein [Brevibacillus porteri]|uniref:Uncharacterized protein n=1 Tax=Brevibacillus porteri TaxID=2126350 RepID=A0ABX5FIL6_9BACL|nr:hypothetical protein [Brevibacillus porteri]MED1800286.1 hypothetical protein [Brevibacillus porteri]MED2130794.1 hypothetical protein [Brevibacillus porteri]MED2744945.1 hypothetical protein [Brevibacillus porteri]MED2813395.1 hypothetical protein [Brevibacillus porteri]MED2894992.1 hypothetical protein [Brevibacillus porteri]